jgi:hypothetical protein
LKQRLSERIKLGPKDRVNSGITFQYLFHCAFSPLETQVRVLILNIMYIDYSDSYVDDETESGV